MADKQVLKTIGEDPASGKKLSRAAVWNMRLTAAASLASAWTGRARLRIRAIRKDSGNLSRQHKSMAR
jgi:hypothetical protein